MNGVHRVVVIAACGALLGGCSAVWNESVGRAPSITPAPSPTPIPYKSTLAVGAKCERLNSSQLESFQDAAAIGGAIKYTHGVVVKANDGWSLAVLHTEVYANNMGYTRENVPETAFWAADAAALDSDGWGVDPTFHRVSGASTDPVAAMALACLKAELAKS